MSLMDIPRPVEPETGAVPPGVDTPSPGRALRPGRGRRIGPPGRRAAALALRVGVSVGILAYLVSILDWDHLRRLAGQIRPGALWAAPALVIASFYLGGVRWSLLLRHFGVPLRAREGFAIYLIGGFYNILLPGVLGGDVIRISLCAAQFRKPIPEVAVTTMMERGLGLLAVLLVGAAASLLLPVAWAERLGPIGVVLPVMAVGAVVAAAVGWAALHLSSAALSRREFAWRPLRALVRVAGRLRELPARTLLLALGLSVLCHLAAFLAAYLLGGAIGIDLPLRIYCVVMPLVTLSTVLPISLGGLGVREGALTLLLARAGVAPSDAVALAFLLYLNMAAVALVGGITQLLWQPRVGRREVVEVGPERVRG